MSGIDEIFKDDATNSATELVDWVMGKCNDWRDHYESNYAEKHEEYMRLYRNQWSAEDMERKSERSKLIAPALAQAVESNVAEIEESMQHKKENSLTKISYRLYSTEYETEFGYCRFRTSKVQGE